MLTVILLRIFSHLVFTAFPIIFKFRLVDETSPNYNDGKTHNREASEIVTYVTKVNRISFSKVVIKNCLLSSPNLLIVSLLFSMLNFGIYLIKNFWEKKK